MLSGVLYAAMTLLIRGYGLACCVSFRLYHWLDHSEAACDRWLYRQDLKVVWDCLWIFQSHFGFIQETIMDSRFEESCFACSEYSASCPRPAAAFVPFTRFGPQFGEQTVTSREKKDRNFLYTIRYLHLMHSVGWGFLWRGLWTFWDAPWMSLHGGVLEQWQDTCISAGLGE